MNNLSKLLRHSDIRKQWISIASYILNIVIISFFMMIITGISNLVNESLSPNDFDQALAIIFSMIGIAIITILFFQWIIGTIFKSLFTSRKNFNLNIRLMGFSKKNLYFLYFKEFLSMQIISVPVGLVCAWGFYYLIAKFFLSPLGIMDIHINALSLILSPIIHIIVVLFSITRAFRALSKISLSDQLRSSSVVDDKFTFTTRSYIKTVVGLLMLFGALTPVFIKVDPATASQINLLAIAAYFFLYDAIFFVFSKVIQFVYKNTKIGVLSITNQIMIGNFKKIKAINFMILISVVLHIGLQSAFLTARQAGYWTADEHVLFHSMETSAELNKAPSQYDVNNEYFTLKFIASKSQSSSIKVLGVDGGYIDKYEKIVLDPNLSDFSKEELLKNINDSSWNGIVFPESYISTHDIGNEFIATIDGIEIPFVIEGGYYVSNLSEFKCLVSKSYLESQLGMQGMSNIVFSLQEKENIWFENSTVMTRMDLINESYEKAVNSTIFMEITAYIVLLCAIIMLLNYIYLSSNESIMNIARLRGIGMSARNVASIYVWHFLIIIFEAFVFTAPFSVLFSASFCLAALDKYYFPFGTILPHDQFFITFILFIVPALVVFFLSTAKPLLHTYPSLLREKFSD